VYSGLCIGAHLKRCPAGVSTRWQIPSRVNRSVWKLTVRAGMPDNYTCFREMKISRVRDFRGFGKLPAARKRKDRQRIGSADPSRLQPVPGTESPREIWLGRWNRSRASQAPGLREFRLAESQQILPPAGNRKPASDRTQDPTCPMLVQAQVVPWWGTGRPAELSPSGSNPVSGTANRQEDRGVRLQNRVVSGTARRALHTLPGN